MKKEHPVSEYHNSLIERLCQALYSYPGSNPVVDEAMHAIEQCDCARANRDCRYILAHKPAEESADHAEN